MKNSGSCACNAVQYELNSPPKTVVNCHCNFCRKHSGAAFSTFVVVPEAAFEIISGKDTIAVGQTKENAYKYFCKQCGSPLYNKNARYPGLCMVYLGGLTESQNLVPTANIYCESQLAWVPAIAEIKSFEQGIIRQAK